MGENSLAKQVWSLHTHYMEIKGHSCLNLTLDMQMISELRSYNKLYGVGNLLSVFKL